MKKTVIVDTDLTVDDIAALKILAQNDAIDIKAVTVSGEAAQKYTAETLRGQLNINCTVAAGAAKPIFKERFSNECPYGKADFAIADLTCGENSGKEYPWDVILSEAQKAGGNLQIITLGPLTNIAITLLRYPQVKSLIKRIFVAAGANYIGNAAPYSEYNAFCDPDALQIVIDCGVPVTMFPLEACENYRTDDEKDIGYSAAAATAFFNENIQTKEYYVKCETRNGDNQGWTIIDRLCKYKKEPNITVVI